MTLRLALEPLPRQAISVARAVEIMGDDPATIRRLLEAGELEGYRGSAGTIPPRWRVYVDSIEAYRRRRSVAPANDDRGPPLPAPPKVAQTARHRASLAALKAARWL